MKDELPFDSPELSFYELWSRMKPWLAQRGLIKAVRKRKSAYTVTKMRQELEKSMHSRSAQYY